MYYSLQNILNLKKVSHHYLFPEDILSDVLFKEVKLSNKKL